MSDPDDLVAELARLPAGEQRRLVAAALDERTRAIDAALLAIRRVHLADLSGRAAAREISRAARGSGIRSVDPALRALIASQLKEKLGDLRDLPSEESIRKSLGSIILINKANFG